MEQDSLLILETMDEAQYYVNSSLQSDVRLKNCIILSLEPNIHAYLLEKGLESQCTADIINGQSYQRIMDKCEGLEDYICCELERQSIEQPAEYFVNAYWHFLRLIWRHLLWNIELLDRCLENKEYRRIFAFKYGRVVTRSPWTEDDQRYMGDIAEKLCTLRGLEFIPVLPPSLTLREAEKETSTGWYQDICNRISYRLSRLSAAILSLKKAILVPSFKYNMNCVCDDIAEKDGNLKCGIFYLGKQGIMEVLHALAIFLHVLAGRKMYKASVGYPVDYAFPIMTFAKYYNKSYDDSMEREYIDEVVKVIDNGKRPEMAYKSVDLSGFLVQKIRDDLTPYMLNIRFQAFGLEKLMDTFKPDCIISQMTGEIYGALGNVAKKMDIPSVLISHGSHVYQTDKYAARENDILARNILIGGYRYSAVQSPLAREIACHMVDDPSRVVNIRPTLWGRAINRVARKKSDGLTIIHAGTFKLRHNRRYIYETADEFLKGLRELSETISEFPQLRLIIKIRAIPYELSPETMNALLPKAGNVTIEAKKPFLEVLEEADLVVSFSSTTIEEALSNRIPVLLYGAQGRYAHIPEEPFSDKNSDITKAVTFVNNRGQLNAYMEKLNGLGASFHVPDEAFDKYRFSDDEVTDLTTWILGLMKERS